MKLFEREQARALRQHQGQSIKEIARALGVSRSSVSVWVRGIELTTEQQSSLRLRNPIFNAQLSGARTRSLRAREKRLRAQQEGRLAARRNDPVHAGACMLYWGEGWKSRNTAQLSNSDPEMLAFFLSFLRRFFGVRDEEVRIQCNLHADNADDVRTVQAFWLRILELPVSCLTKAVVNSVSRSSQEKRTNMLPYGTCRLTVHSTAIVQHLYGAIQEYAGFDRPDWLDL